MTPTPRAWLMAYPGDDSTDWCEHGPDEPPPEAGFMAMPLFDQAAIDSAVAAGRLSGLRWRWLRFGWAEWLWGIFGGVSVCHGANTDTPQTKNATQTTTSDRLFQRG